MRKASTSNRHFSRTGGDREGKRLRRCASRERSGRFVSLEGLDHIALCSCKGTPLVPTAATRPDTKANCDNNPVIRANGRNHRVLCCYLSWDAPRRDREILLGDNNKRVSSINYTSDLELALDGSRTLSRDPLWGIAFWCP